MYGLIGKIIAIKGQREELMKILIEGGAGIPGCLSYIVAKDQTDPDAIWVTEVWENQARHQESLSLPAVQTAIERGKPLIASFGERYETTPIGGSGIGQE